MTPDAALVERIVEAALLAAGQPLSLAQLRELFVEDEAPAPGAIEQAIEALRAQAPQRGIELVEVASGFRFQVRAEVQPWVGRLWAERQTRYSRAQLETLALIAYRQPITRGEIEQIRGVAVSSHIIRTLEEREWIRVVGHRDVPGKPALFGTTRTFLDYFNLKSLDQLPPLSELRDIPDFDPQLSLEPGAAQVLSDAFGADALAAAATAPAATGPVAEDAAGTEPEAAARAAAATDVAPPAPDAESAGPHDQDPEAGAAPAIASDSPTDPPTTGSASDEAALPEQPA